MDFKYGLINPKLYTFICLPFQLRKCILKTLCLIGPIVSSQSLINVMFSSFFGQVSLDVPLGLLPII
ncbi:MAG: hypothetical protein AAFW73_11130, partial [Bacteroidota bacterium]